MKRLSRNILSILGSDIARRILGFLAVAYIARSVGSAGFGIISIGFAVLSYALMLSSAGMSSYGVREIARGEGRSLAGTIITIRLVSGILLLLIVVIIALFIPDRNTALVIVLFCLSLFPNAFLLDWYFQGREEMGMVGMGRFLSAVVYLGVVLWFVHDSAGIVWVAVASVLGDCTSALFIFSAFRRKEDGRPLQFSLSGWKEVLSQSIPMGAGYIFGQISINMPTLVLGILCSNRDVGMFNASSKLVFFLLMLDRVLATILLPASSRLKQSSPDLLAASLGTALRWSLILALPVCTGGMILAGKIVPLVFGSQYLPAVDVFRILIWFFLVTILHTVYSAGMIASGGERAFSRIMAIGFVLYTVTSIVAAQGFGIAGAASAMVISEGVTMLFMRRQLKQLVAVGHSFPVAGILAATVLMGFVVALLPSLPLVLGILVGFAVYSGALFAVRAITVRDVTELMRRFA